MRILVIILIGVALLAIALLATHVAARRDERIDYGPYLQAAYRIVSNELYANREQSVAQALTRALQELKEREFGNRSQLDQLTIYYNDSVEVWVSEDRDPDTIFLMSGSLTVIGRSSGYSAQVQGRVRLLTEAEADAQQQVLRLLPRP